MRLIRSDRFPLVAVVPCALAFTAACGGADGEFGEANDELTLSGTFSTTPTATAAAPVPPPVVNGELTTEPKWVVRISINHPTDTPPSIDNCSAWVLNEHWLLTAAHCFERATNGEIVQVARVDRPGDAVGMYRGPGTYFGHPQWAGGSEHDIGLVHLDHIGIPLNQTGVAKMYSDPRRPWVDSNLPADMTVVGWGRSVADPSDPSGCVEGSGGKLRTTGAMAVDVSSATASVLSATFGSTSPCAGDSGAPWLLRRGDAAGVDFFGFAVLSRLNRSLHIARGTPLDDNRAWLESTVITSRPPGNKYGTFCFDAEFGGFKFRQCDQSSPGSGQLKALGKCMRATSATPGSLVTMAICNKLDTAQIWTLLPTGEIRSLLTPNLCLESVPAVIGNPLPHVAVCNDAANNNATQRFGNGPLGQLQDGIDFTECVTAVPDPVASTGGASTTASSPATNVATFSSASFTGTATLASTTTSGAVTSARPCVGVACQPKVIMKACDGDFPQRWAFGTF